MQRGLATPIKLACLLGLAALVYWPGLNGPLILDDAANLDILRRLDEQGELSLANVIAERGGLFGGRPVSWASFVLSWRLWGDDLWVFKLENLLIHLVNGVLVWMIARRLLAAGTGMDRAARDWAALAVCAFWLLTPMQVSTVLYVVQRMTLLSALFSLLGLLLYCAGRLRLRRDEPGAGLLIMAAVAICWPLAALSKQNGALLVLLLASIELLVFRDARPAWPRRLVLGASLATLMAGLIRFAVDPEWILSTYALRDFTLTERLLTQPRVLLDYALNVLQLPGGSPLGLFHGGFPRSGSPWQPPSTLFALALWITVLFLAWRNRGRSTGVALFGLTFFLVGHALEAGPFALEIYFEHRNYLPSLGLWLSLVFVAWLGSQRLARPRLIASLVGVVLAGHVALSAARVSVWTSWEGIIEANASAHPESPRARAGAAIIDFRNARLASGLENLAAVRQARGQSAEAAVVLKSFVGHCLSREPPPGELLERLRRLRHLSSDPYTLGALRWYRSVVESRECPGLDQSGVVRALHRLSTARRRDAVSYGQDWVMHSELAHLLSRAGTRDLAITHLQRALRLAPPSRRDELSARLEALDADPPS